MYTTKSIRLLNNRKLYRINKSMSFAMLSDSMRNSNSNSVNGNNKPNSSSTTLIRFLAYSGIGTVTVLGLGYYAYKRHIHNKITKIPVAKSFTPILNNISAFVPNNACYIELQFNPTRDILTQLDAHKPILQCAVANTLTELYIGINCDISQCNVNIINNLLSNYYAYLGSISYNKYGPNYDINILLPISDNKSNGIENVRSRILSLPHLQTIWTINTNNDDNNYIQSLVNKRKLLRLNPLNIQELPNPNRVGDAFKANTVDNARNNANVLNLYGNVVIGGTFDHLHIGHKILLSVSSLIATKSLVIGLTSPNMLSKKSNLSQLESWNIRAAQLYWFINLINPSISVDIVELFDMYGPSGDRANLEVIVVSEETAEGGGKVNIKRQENKLNTLQIVTVSLAKPDITNVNIQAKISSTEIRRWQAEQAQNQLNWLKTEWLNLVNNLNNKIDNNIHSNWFDTIVNYYKQPHRSYHNLTHIYNLIQLSLIFELNLDNIHAVQLAIWFHDIIYNTKPHNNNTNNNQSNEQLSANLFNEFAIRYELTPKLKNKVYNYILATIKHSNEWNKNDNDLQFFLDFDLSVLSFNPKAYNLYTAQIREEYSHFDDTKFVTGRMAVMNKFLERPKLYYTKVFQDHCELIARQNITQEISFLQKKLTTLQQKQ